MTSEQYTKRVAKYLLCRADKKKEIVKQLQSDIAAAMENGASLEAAIARMGNPKALAQELNENFDEEEKKAVKRRKRGKLIAVIAAVLLLLIGGIYWLLPKSKAIRESTVFTEAEVIQKAEKMITLLDQENYETLETYMTDSLKKAVSEETLQKAKTQICEDFGAFQRYKNTYAAEITQYGKVYATVQLNASYENVSVIYTLSFDEHMKLAGIYMR